MRKLRDTINKMVPERVSDRWMLVYTQVSRRVHFEAENKAALYYAQKRNKAEKA